MIYKWKMKVSSALIAHLLAFIAMNGLLEVEDTHIAPFYGPNLV